MVLRIKYRYGASYQTSWDNIRLKEGESYIDRIEQWKLDNPKYAIWIEDYELRNWWPDFDLMLSGGRRNNINTNEYNPD